MAKEPVQERPTDRIRNGFEDILHDDDDM